MTLVLTFISYFVIAMFVVFLIAASGYGLLREFDRWKEEKMSGKKRLGVVLGQPLEVEYTTTPETEKYAAGVEVTRVFAYTGAVRVDVTPLLNEMGDGLMKKITDRCLEAEGISPGIPY